jgi:metal-dependent hydrolase (beta-lactamase superfamily II)
MWTGIGHSRPLRSSVQWKQKGPMNKCLVITILDDNCVDEPDLLAERGSTVLLEVSGNTIVLSQGHYDHTGSLAQVLGLIGQVAIFHHPAALKPKYSCPGAKRFSMKI